MMNEKEINTCIGCGVTECKYNCSGDLLHCFRRSMWATPVPAKRKSAPAAIASNASNFPGGLKETRNRPFRTLPRFFVV